MEYKYTHFDNKHDPLLLGLSSKERRYLVSLSRRCDWLLSKIGNSEADDFYREERAATLWAINFIMEKLKG
jgi:hypothetical protein